MQTKTIVATLILLSIATVVVAYALLSAYLRIGNYAKVKTVGVSVYWDPALTQPVTEINWGLLEPDSTHERLIYIENTGNTPATLSLTTESWNPALAQTYITLTWNYTEQLLNPNEAIPTTLTLTVSAEITGITNFSFDIIITTEG